MTTNIDFNLSNFFISSFYFLVLDYLTIELSLMDVILGKQSLLVLLSFFYFYYYPIMSEKTKKKNKKHCCPEGNESSTRKIVLNAKRFLPLWHTHSSDRKGPFSTKNADFYAFLAQRITDFLWVSKPHVSSVSPLICFHSVVLSYGDSL